MSPDERPLLQVGMLRENLPKMFFRAKELLREAGQLEAAASVTAFKLAPGIALASACYLSGDVVVMLMECGPDDAQLIVWDPLLGKLRENMEKIREFLTENPQIKVMEVGLDGRTREELNQLDFGNLEG